MQPANAREVKEAMKRTTHLNVTKDATDVMLGWISENIIIGLKVSEKVAKESGSKTIGLDKGLSSSKIIKFAKQHTDMSVSPKFVEGIKSSLSGNIARITTVATIHAVDDKRKSISADNVKLAIADTMKTEEAYVMEDEPIMPDIIQEVVYKELGPVCSDSVEVIADKLSTIFYSMTKNVLKLSTERGRGKGAVKVEDVMDGV